ncbi:ATP synthase F1 subunit epsilon [Clostridium fermenticellae]|uniref:ATP synthase epsilon chain n=1 Tax=Clostridium fermenticellae TaxID=2068654 RepID=A0A386H0W4_9CLOT|nr:F0F1 ATP synthase subunit epsilon [Clostridium fermenticellae]AYD39205.1 ATP synthase F1 subunit epsilon [Clostridium fermenticellae]
MADALKLTINTPEKNFYTGEVVEILTDSSQGRIGILKNHIPLVTTLVPNITEIVDKDGKKIKAFTSTGILEVKDNSVNFLCDSCEWPDEIDFNRAEEAKERAENRLKEKDNVDVRRAELALSRALARISLK